MLFDSHNQELLQRRFSAHSLRITLTLDTRLLHRTTARKYTTTIMYPPHILTGLAALISVPGAMAGLYPKSSSVLQLDGKSYEKMIAKSNHTSIIEFYAPWCGHCQSLQPAYEKAASHLHSLAPIAAVNCDDDANKGFCASMGVQGYPTLKIVRPSKKGKLPMVDDYRGERSASAIVEAVTSMMNNHVVRVTDNDVDIFLEGVGPKVLLFTEKGGTSTLMKSLAIDFLGSASIGQIRSKEKATVKKFDVTEFPTLVLINGDETRQYTGKLKKTDIVTWVSKFASPNPDASKWDKAGKPKAVKKPEAKPKASKPKEEPKTEEPKKEEPITFTSKADVESMCLTSSSHKTCIIIFNNGAVEDVQATTRTAVDFVNKSYKGPWVSQVVGGDVEKTVKKALGVSQTASLAVVNRKRNWVVAHNGEVSLATLQAFVEGAKDGSAKREKLGETVLADGHDEL